MSVTERSGGSLAAVVAGLAMLGLARQLPRPLPESALPLKLPRLRTAGKVTWEAADIAYCQVDTMTTSQPSTRGIVRLATGADHDAIHALNYRTFVEEIPQHEPNATRRHVDRFHDENVYAVYEVNGRIIGMISGRTQRPFSLDQKLGRVDHYLPVGRTPVEIRLLAVEPAFRASRVFAQLIGFMSQYFLANGFDLGIMSGTTRQLRLYRHLGFHAFGPLIGTEQASYQPMYITAEEVLLWPDAMHQSAVAARAATA